MYKKEHLRFHIPNIYIINIQKEILELSAATCVSAPKSTIGTTTQAILMTSFSIIKWLLSAMGATLLNLKKEVHV